MRNPKFQVSGRHINELSENIPSNIFALNELIKNSYDACATYCHIKLDPKARTLTIIDDGHGLNEQSIEELFHISRSSKRFGEKQSCGKATRRIQGSKGLGFLAAFRFGGQVRWDTHNNGTRYIFSVDKAEIQALQNIATHIVQVEEEKSDAIGTTITINGDQNDLEALERYFSEDENSLKLVGSFSEDTFDIDLELSNRTVTSRAIPKIKDVNPDDQLFYITYDSRDSKILFYRGGFLEKTIQYSLGSKEYSIELELIIFSLESYGRKRISPYFTKPRTSSITPLTFINNNLFNNFDLFDADLLRSKRSSSALPQIIGFVKIDSESNSFQFNSDRTNFVENPTTLMLAKNLRALNELIQIEGSKLKATAKLGPEKLTGPAYPKGGAGSGHTPLVRAKIELKRHFDTHLIPSKQVDLLEYVDAISDSKGNHLSKSHLEIEIDEKRSNSNILASQTKPKEIAVLFRFNDADTGSVASRLDLEFKERSASVTGKEESKSLFYILGSSIDYKIEIVGVATLMNQIVDAHNLHPRFSHLIACSLRTVFELSTQAIARNRPLILQEKSDGKQVIGRSNEIKKVILFLKMNNSITTEVAKHLGLSFRNLAANLDKDEVEQQFIQANIGAHSGDQHLTTGQIADIAKTAGYYAAFCDVLVNVLGSERFNSCDLTDLKNAHP